jgi:hypothetical protein
MIRRLAPLPGPCDRMSPHRKGAICEHVLFGSLTKLDACERFDLSLIELEAWLVSYVCRGVPGLRVGRPEMAVPEQSEPQMRSACA